jgi:cleavage stimulation factor subunit 2
MWGGPAAPQQGHYGQQGGGGGGGGAGAPSSNAPKHDIFVGNLAFNTTEEQLHQAFSELGRVLNVRMVTDVETGKPRGFAFVEFEDPQAALSAIRNMNDYELNGRRLRVNFSNSSHLEALAGKLGMDLSQQTQRSTPASASAPAGGSSSTGGTSAVADALKGLNKGEMFDVIAKLKEISDRDPDEARRIISGHPQLPEALLFCMSKLEMVQTPVASESAVLPPIVPKPAGAPPPAAAPPSRPADPRARAVDPRAASAAAAAAVAAAAPPPPPRADPRARAAAADPRARMQQQQQQAAPPRPPPPPAYGVPPPPPPNNNGGGGGGQHLDPGLIQQVMSLTPQQISQLPPDKQQSILALRQQITGNSR